MSGSSLPGTGQAGCSGNSLGRLYSWAGPDQTGRSAGSFGILATALPGTFQDLPNLTMRRALSCARQTRPEFRLESRAACRRRALRALTRASHGRRRQTPAVRPRPLSHAARLTPLPRSAWSRS
jgi:hypothetical protein